jgi:hypothetical protein
MGPAIVYIICAGLAKPQMGSDYKFCVKTAFYTADFQRKWNLTQELLLQRCSCMHTRFQKANTYLDKALPLQTGFIV